ncbi:MAG TPA: RNA-binding protein [Ignavibacteria bacterium]
MKIYVGNISRESTENEIRDMFTEFGEVTEITLIRDNYTKVLKGFGFIEMADKEAGEKAIKELDGQLFNGRPLTVNVAKPKTDTGNRTGGRERRFRRN